MNLLDSKVFGAAFADRCWVEHPDYHDRELSFTVDQLLVAYKRAGGANDRRFAASASRYATRRWVDLRTKASSV